MCYLVFVDLCKLGTDWIIGKRGHIHISLEQMKDNSKNISPFVLFPHVLSFTCRLNFAAYRVTLDIIFLSIPHNIISHPAIATEIMNVYNKYIIT